MKHYPTLLALTFLLLCRTALAQPVDVNRVLRTFDFEERRLGNAEDLPMHWLKVQGPGLPHYVNGKLATDLARGGKYSFRFELNGGGLVYRYAPDQIRVTRGAHYRVEGYCRTTVLAHARARMTAYFVDLDGHVLPDTVRHTDPYAARAQDEDWSRMAIELSAESPKAAFLVLELGLLQPSQYGEQALGQRTLNVQDVKGTAWFDDITVSQVPRVAMGTERPGNIFRRGEPVRLQVRVDDRFTEDLSAQLLVRDADGKNVYQRSGALDTAGAEALGPGRKRVTLDLPELPAGWYQAALVMSSQGQHLGSQSLAFIQLADNAAPPRPDHRFGFVATSLPFDGWDELPGLLPQLAAGRVKLALWGPGGDIQEHDPAAFDTLLERLAELGITPTACLLDLPPALAQKLQATRPASGEAGTWAKGPVPAAAKGAALPSPSPVLPLSPSSSWPLLLRADPADWQPQLAYLISRHANHLDRWQLGDDASEAFVTDPKMRQVYKLVYGQFARLVQKPDLAMPWPAWYELDGELPATVALSVPSSVVLPSQLPLYMQDLRGKEGQNLSISLEPLERDRYGRNTQVRDLAQRVVYALAADAQRIDLPLPFVTRREGGVVIKEPQELLLVVRTLITTLSGTTYRGRVPIGEGVEAFLFDRSGQGVLALWDRGSQGATVRELALNLGERPATIDLWGNVTPLMRKSKDTVDGKPLAAGEVKLALGSMPIFLVDIDGQLAQTRASVALDRPLIESSFQPHARRVRFTNAYRQAVSGSLKLKAPAGWTINPPSFQFTLNPGETFDREIGIEIPYNSVAGPKNINAEFVVQGERNSTFTVPITVSLGLSDVGMQTLALRDGGDVVVQQMITNYGDKPIDYSAFALFPGQARQERILTGLKPGTTTVKRYRFANVTIVPGTKVRAGVKELVGTRILNDEVVVQ